LTFAFTLALELASLKLFFARFPTLIALGVRSPWTAHGALSSLPLARATRMMSIG
jgi:hypothetical protein